MATATYTGPAYAAINNQAVTGTYQNVWNFGSRSGVAMMQIDNTTYGGGTAANTFQVGNTAAFRTNGPIYSATSTAAPRSLTLDGVFLSTPTSPARYQFGVFNLAGPNNYTGTGVFLGTK